MSTSNDKAKARRDANRYKAIEDGLETLLAVAEKLNDKELGTHLYHAKIAAEAGRFVVESYHGIEATQIIPFKRGPKK